MTLFLFSTDYYFYFKSYTVFNYWLFKIHKTIQNSLWIFDESKKLFSPTTNNNII